jgi:hypothetical protein
MVIGKLMEIPTVYKKFEIIGCTVLGIGIFYYLLGVLFSRLTGTTLKTNLSYFNVEHAERAEPMSFSEVLSGADSKREMALLLSSQGILLAALGVVLYIISIVLFNLK